MFKMVILSFLVLSCSRLPFTERLSPYKFNYDLEDKSGKYEVQKEVGISKDKTEFIVKQHITPFEKEETVERYIIISTLDKLGKIEVLRPKISQFTVWFGGKRFFTELKYEHEQKSIFVTMQSPEKNWNGKQTIKLPTGTGVYCFWGQMVECLKATGFLEEAKSKDMGTVNFHLIFEGYPYISEMYEGVAPELLTPASFEYDGISKQGDKRFTLRFQEQTIVYELNSQDQIIKVFWVAQGHTLIKK